MRFFLTIFILISSALSGCIGEDELFPEERGIPGGLALACLKDTKFTKMELHFLCYPMTTRKSSRITEYLIQLLMRHSNLSVPVARKVTLMD